MPDGRAVLISRSDVGTSNDLAFLPLDRPEALTPLTSGAGRELEPAPSPDGRWVAFVSERAGRPEVVVAQLLAEGRTVRLDAPRPISSAGGIDPEWRHDGREIVYLAPDSTLMAVSVTIAGSAGSLGKPSPLFKVPADAGGWGSNWDVTADHTKFVVVEAPRAAGQRFRVLTDWGGK
jgi:serine/threonine-protein kinase